MIGQGPGHQLAGAQPLAFIHATASSGSSASLRDALNALVPVTDVDLAQLTREPRLLPSRIRAVLEARASMNSSWIKTGSWTRAVEAWASRDIQMRHSALFFMQTLCAWTSVEVPYYIYTDRVFLEGASTNGRHRSMATPDWIERERTHLRRASYVFTAGRQTRRWLVEHYGIPGERVGTVGAGVNSPVKAALPQPLAEDSPPRLLFVGRQWELHGGPELVQALRQVKSQFPGVYLTVVGTDHRRLPADISRSVEFLGKVPRAAISTLMRDSHIYVRPSHQDAFPKATLEALLAGRPVIGTNRGNQAELIGDCGYTIPDPEPDLIADAIVSVLNNYSDIANYTYAASPKLAEQYNWNNVASQIIAILRRDLSDT